MALSLFGDLQHALGSRDVHGDGLLKIDVLARFHHYAEMLGMEVGRGGDDDRIYVLRFGHLPAGVRPHPGLRNAGVAFILRGSIQALLGGVDLILEKVGQRRHAGARLLDDSVGVRGAAAAASQQPHAHRRIGIGAAHQARIQNRKYARRSGGLQERAAFGIDFHWVTQSTFRDRPWRPESRRPGRARSECARAGSWRRPRSLR